MDLVVELSKLIENALHCFDALPNAGVPGGDGLCDVSVGEVRGRSASRLLLRVAGTALFLGLLWLVRDSLALLVAVGLAMVVGNLLFVRYSRRASHADKDSAFGAMDERLRAVVEHLVAFRNALPSSHGRLAEALRAIEVRMLRIFTNRDVSLETALVKLTCKVFGYPGFDRLAASVAGVSNALGALRFALAQEAAVRTARAAPGSS